MSDTNNDPEAYRPTVERIDDTALYRPRWHAGIGGALAGFAATVLCMLGGAIRFADPTRVSWPIFVALALAAAAIVWAVLRRNPSLRWTWGMLLAPMVVALVLVTAVLLSWAWMVMDAPSS